MSDARERYERLARAIGVFGAALDPPAGLDEATRLLAYLGRRAW